ncbi:MAG: hypothetical protein KIS73_12960 [Enhydrobacter sp.]|nr:hypothetical protein [Enhydrobacter sp.]
MKFRIAGAAAALIAGGCGTSEDVKRTGIVWQGTVAARYDQLAKCLSTQTTLYYKSALQFDTARRRATVTFSIPVTGIPVEVYDVRQVSDEATEVSWSTRLERGRQQVGKPYYLLDQCGATPLPSSSAAPPPPVPPAPSSAPPGSQEPNWAPEPETDGRGGR